MAPAEEGCRIVGIACAVLLWSTYAYMIWTPTVLDRAGSVKGWDFPQFYALGDLAVQGRIEAVSDGAALGAQAGQDVSPTLARSTFVPVYGPQIALMFAPLARLSYLGALRCWIGFSILLYATCCVILSRACPSLKAHTVSVGLLAMGSPALFFLICYGQLSTLALGLFTAAFVALQRRLPLLAGVAVGSLIYKPQLGLAMGMVFLCAGEWRLITGSLGAAATQIGVAWAFAGTTVMRSYIHTISHLNDNIALVQEKRHLLQSLSSFFDLLLPWPQIALAAYLAASVVMLAATWLVWRSAAPLGARYSMLLLATALISPHFYVYDLLVLTPVSFLLADSVMRQEERRDRTVVTIWLGMLYIAPLVSAGMARTIHVQPTVPIMSALAFVIARRALHVREGRRVNDDLATRRR